MVIIHSPVPLLLAAIILFSVSVNLIILGTSYKSNTSVFVLFWLVYFTRH